jgi:magnesium chelatase family protein
MGPADLSRHAALDVRGRELLLRALARFGLSARGFDRVRRVSRTLADLEGEEKIRADHVCEALQYRHAESSGMG